MLPIKSTVCRGATRKTEHLQNSETDVPIKSTVCRGATRKTDTDQCTIFLRPDSDICQQSIVNKASDVTENQAANVKHS